MTNTRQMFLALGPRGREPFPASVATFDRAHAAATSKISTETPPTPCRCSIEPTPLRSRFPGRRKPSSCSRTSSKPVLVFGGSYGEGVLNEGPRIRNYYNSVSASWGFQAGAQSYGYVVFLMNRGSHRLPQRIARLGTGCRPDPGGRERRVAKNLSTSTLKGDAYAFIFNQEGLMASVSIEGTKISRIYR